MLPPLTPGPPEGLPPSSQRRESIGRLMVIIATSQLVATAMALGVGLALRQTGMTAEHVLYGAVALQAVVGLGLSGAGMAGMLAQGWRPTVPWPTSSFQATWQAQLIQQAREAAVRAERDRMARELHDSIKQQLFAISVDAATVQARWGSTDVAARDAVADIQRSARDAQVEMQALLQQLRGGPLEGSSLPEALRVQARALETRTGAAVTVEIGELPTEDRLPPGTQEAIFRIAQEALANIARHARAQHVTLALEQSEQSLRLHITDDGQGFDLALAPRGMGLGNMLGRAAELQGAATLTSAPGSGTTLVVTIPLVPTRQDAAVMAQVLATRQAWLGRVTALYRLSGYLCIGVALVAIAILALHFSPAIILLPYIAAVGIWYYGRFQRQMAAPNTLDDQMRYQTQRLEFTALFNLVRTSIALFYVPSLAWGSVHHAWFWFLLPMAFLVYILANAQVRRAYQRFLRTYFDHISVVQRQMEINNQLQLAAGRLRSWLILSAGLLVSVGNIVYQLQRSYLVVALLGASALVLVWGATLYGGYRTIQNWQQMYRADDATIAKEAPHV